MSPAAAFRYRRVAQRVASPERRHLQIDRGAEAFASAPVSLWSPCASCGWRGVSADRPTGLRATSEMLTLHPVVAPEEPAASSFDFSLRFSLSSRAVHAASTPLFTRDGRRVRARDVLIPAATEEERADAAGQDKERALCRGQWLGIAGKAVAPRRVRWSYRDRKRRSSHMKARSPCALDFANDALLAECGKGAIAMDSGSFLRAVRERTARIDRLRRSVAAAFVVLRVGVSRSYGSLGSA
jgi:hypothetical protein